MNHLVESTLHILRLLVTILMQCTTMIIQLTGIFYHHHMVEKRPVQPVEGKNDDVIIHS